MACLDTTFLIDLAGNGGRGLRRRAEAKLRALQLADDPLTTTRFNVAELWVGAARSSTPDVEAAAVETLVESFLVLEFDSRAARIFGSIAASAQSRGRPIGDMDALIASVALCHGQKLVTRNERHFNEILGLVVETY